MKKRYSLITVFIVTVLAIGVTFSATYFPMQHLMAEQEAEYRDQCIDHVERPDEYDMVAIGEVIDWLSRHSIYELPDRNALTEAMIKGILAETGDRYARYFNEVEYAEYMLGLNGNFVGIGVTLVETEEGEAEIVLIHSGAPIEGVGQLGDVIVAVNGARLCEIGYDAGVAAIAGEAGSELELTVRRGGTEIKLVLERAKVEKQTVISRMTAVDGRSIGYVLLTGFDRNTYKQFTSAVSKLELAGAEALVFDVRSNGGGLLSEIAKVLAYVLPDGEIAHVNYTAEELKSKSYVIRAEGGSLSMGSSAPFVYAEGGHQITVPVAVLVNDKTASAAELFASAFRDYAAEGRIDATLVGITTYGKGTVQSTYELLGNTGFKFSTAYYNPPTNVSYDGIGITPDIRTELPEELRELSLLKLSETDDTQLQAALEALRVKLGS